MIEEIIKISKKASLKILDIYNKCDLNIKYKEDESPITLADSYSNDIIISELKKISDYPILSEENEIIDYSIRKTWKYFWMIDPLDGTKDFIAKNDQFTINIALIENCKPILGVINAPSQKQVYWAQIGKGAYLNNKKIYNHSNRTHLIGADSLFHSTDKTKEFFLKNHIEVIKRYGSALKICKLAEGEIDVYPRFNGTKEWDTAAAQIIAEEAGCKVIDIITKKEMLYNKDNIKNNYFIASRRDLKFI
jgi:3'(2'), 5'-bisphosphate nucleotidase